MTQLRMWVGGGLVAALLVGQAIVGAQSARTLEMQLKAAQYKADVQGDFKGAIEDYRRIADGTDRAAAAKALLATAELYQKTGTGDARAVFTRVVQDYPEQRDVVRAASVKLAARAGVGQVEVTPRRVRYDGETATNISISTDGRFAVGQEASADGGNNIVLRDILSGRQITLVAGSLSGFGTHPQISNDGRRVAYGWSERVAGGPPRWTSLRIVSTEPGSTPVVVMAPQGALSWRPSGWSPDGKTVLAMVQRDGDPTTREGTSREWVWISVESKSVRTIKTIAVQPGPDDFSLSPDGRFIAFSAPSRAGSIDRYIYVMDANGEHETAVVTAAGSRSSPVWTPEGGHLLFVGDAAGGSALWSIAIRDGQAVGEPSIVQPGFAGTPIGMTTSGAFFYTRTVNGGPHEFIAQRNPGPGDRALTFPGSSASWSRDGRLAVVRTGGQGYDLIIREVNTGEERSYRRAGLTNVPPRWFHDGSGVVVVINEPSSGSSAEAFYHVDIRSGVFQRLFARDANGRVRSAVGAISSDDRTLYLTVRNSAGTPWIGIVGVDLATGTERSVVTFGGAGLPGGSPGLAVSPDGTTLAVMARADGAGQSRIFTVGVDGSRPREVLGSFRGAATQDTMRWTPDGRTIVFVAFDPLDPPGNKWRLMRVPAEGGQAEFDGLDFGTLSLLSGPRMLQGNFLNLDLSPDGFRAIVSTLTVRLTELWTIDNLQSVVNSR